MSVDKELRAAFHSTNVCDSNGEVANVVDVIDFVAGGLRSVARSITPNIPGSNDASGSHVASLTEAVMGVTSGLMAISSSISDLADAVRGWKTDGRP
jgi:hypothetical protein